MTLSRLRYPKSITLLVLIVIVEPVTALTESTTFEPAPYTFVDMFTFLGDAAGGELVVSQNEGMVPPVLTISTESGETGSTVAERLASALNAWRTVGREPSDIVAVADGSTLVTTVPIVFVTGSEDGLNIPKAPRSLTAHWDENAEEIRLMWENADEYTSFYCAFPQVSIMRFDKNATTAVIPLSRLFADDTTLHLFREHGSIVCRLVAFAPPVHLGIPAGYETDLIPRRRYRGLPSGVAEVEVGPRSLVEIYRVPFSGGVAPNWVSWNTDDEIRVDVSQGTRWTSSYSEPSRDVSSPSEAPYYQILETHAGTVRGGIYRRFLGVQPGSRYRVNIRLRPMLTGESGEAELRVRAMCMPSSEGNLTPQKLGGDDFGGAIASATFEHTIPFQQTPDAAWAQLDEIVEERGTILTIPDSCDVIHLWIYIKSRDAHVRVEMDWVELVKLPD